MIKKTVWAVLIFFLGSVLVHAEDTVKLTVLTEQNPPYNWEEDGEIKGFSTQIVKEILKRAGLNYSMRCIPWNGAYQTAIKHKNVLLYSTVRMKKREKLFKWVGPLTPYQVFLFKLKSRKDIKISAIEDAKKYRIGVVENDARHLFFQGKEGYTLDIVRENTLNIKKLFAKRIDLIPFQELPLKELTNSLEGYSFDKLEKVMVIDKFSSHFYAVFGKKTSDKIVEKCQTALKSIKEDGTFDKIAGQYNIPGL